MTIRIRISRDARPGGAVRRVPRQKLLAAGFEPGYPLYPLTTFNPLWPAHAISNPYLLAGAPVSREPRLIGSGLVPGDDKIEPFRERLFRVPTQVMALSCSWRDQYFRIEGEYEKPDQTMTWTTPAGRKVFGYAVRMYIQVANGTLGNGYLQLVPIGYRDRPVRPSGDELLWADAFPDLAPADLQ